MELRQTQNDKNQNPQSQNLELGNQWRSRRTPPVPPNIEIEIEMFGSVIKVSKIIITRKSTVCTDL